MRQIRFRGKSIETGEMVYGSLINNMFFKRETNQPCFYIVDPTQFEDYSSFEEIEDIVVEVDPETVGQYTGLQDSKGKGIFEGDVLTSEQYPFQDEGKYNYHGVIEWIEEEASFYMTKRLANKEKRGMSDGISQPIEDIEEFEVIGNIYEHPHLLEVESNE